MILPLLKPKDRPKARKSAYRTMPDGREICSKTPAGLAEYKKRTLLMAERQGGLCALCGRILRPWETSFDHEHGRGSGGSKRDDRIEVNGVWQNAAVHISCNGEKGSRRVPYVVTQYTEKPLAE